PAKPSSRATRIANHHSRPEPANVEMRRPGPHSEQSAGPPGMSRVQPYLRLKRCVLQGLTSKAKDFSKPVVSYLFSVLSFEDEIRADRQPIHARAFETVNRLFRFANDWLILVEAGIQNDRNSRPTLKRSDQIVIQRVFLAAYSLQPARVIHMIDRTKLRPLLGANLVNMQHEGRRMVVLEIFMLSFH